MLNVSLNEVEMLALRATRGAGRPWGVAEEAAMACRWLAARSLPFATPLLATLDAPAGKRTALGFGIALCDEAGSVAGRCPMLPGPLVAPVLLLPFLATIAARTGGGLLVRWPGAAAMLTADRVVVGGDNLAIAAAAPAIDRLADNAAVEGNRLRLATSGVATDPSQWASLWKLAQKTFVPESEDSRSRGAGGGMTDVD